MTRKRAVPCFVVLALGCLPAGAAPITGPANAGTALCRTLAERYRAVLVQNPQALHPDSFYAAGVLEVLRKAHPGGIEIGEPVKRFEPYSSEALTAWSRQPPQAFSIPDDVLEAIEEVGGDDLELWRLPGTHYYGASTISGTGRCYAGTFFDVAKGKARHAAAPADWAEGDCGVDRAFGRIDKTAVAIEDDSDGTPAQSSQLRVIPWRAGHFGKACSITFGFEPRFEAHGAAADPEKDRCSGPDCEAWRQAALALVEAVQKGPDGARAAAVAGLTPALGRDFAALETLAGPQKPSKTGPDPDKADPAASVMSDSPLRLPFVHEGRLYLASLGHVIVGWRYLSDWSVRLQALEGGALVDKAVFTIGMTKGALAKVSVE